MKPVVGPRVWTKLLKIASYAVAALLVVAVGIHFAIRWNLGQRLAIDSPHGIDDAFFATINGREEHIRIRGQDVSNPVVLLLHGGPGFSNEPDTPFLVPYEQSYTLVQWDQPGAGRTFRRAGNTLSSDLTVEDIVDDGIAVAKLVSERLEVDKLILLDLWCADYKGEFMLANRRYCYPLTISDFASRFLLSCDALGTTKEQYAFTVFERAFSDFGLPRAIRTDNGVPFASAWALFNLSKLSVWWLRLGIRIERIKPGHPQQNGRHERMHLTLKKEATKPASKNFLQQQARFDAFMDCYNHERPHQAIGMKYPAELYEPSPRLYRGLTELTYPFHDRTVTVTRCGRICFGRRKINLSTVFAGQNVGVKQVSEQIWLVTFMDYDLGFFDDETCRLESAHNPFEPKVLPMSPV